MDAASECWKGEQTCPRVLNGNQVKYLDKIRTLRNDNKQLKIIMEKMEQNMKKMENDKRNSLEYQLRK